MTHTSDGFLTADRVRSVYERCYRAEGTRPTKNVTVEGPLLRHTFSIRMLHIHRENVIRMLLSIRSEFRTDERGGGSMLMINQRGDNTLWTTDVSDVEKFIALGLASGLMNYCAPRETWAKLPGGAPYIRVDITRYGVTVN